MDAEHLLAGCPEPVDPRMVIVAEQVIECRARIQEAGPDEARAVRRDLGDWLDRLERGKKDVSADARLRAGIRSAMVTALREGGPDMPAREFAVVLSRHLAKFGV